MSKVVVVGGRNAGMRLALIKAKVAHIAILTTCTHSTSDFTGEEIPLHNYDLLQPVDATIPKQNHGKRGKKGKNKKDWNRF